MEFLYLLEKIRLPGLNELMLAVTELGGELPFLVAALIVFCAKELAGIDLAEPVNGFLDVLLPVLVGFGIINDPTAKDTI